MVLPSPAPRPLMTSRTTSLITLHGPDAAAFAHAQFSSHVLGLPTGRWQWSAWLDPKGRVRTVMQLARVADDRLVAVLRGGDAGALAADLQRFVFRSKVKLVVTAHVALSDAGALGDGVAVQQGDALLLGEGEAAVQVGGEAGASDEWPVRHMRHGYAWLPDEAVDTLLPPALSLERLHAVAFDKGCFPGQEIAARLHFLRGHKKHLHLATSSVELRGGATLRRAGNDVGMVLMTHSTTSTPLSLVVINDNEVSADLVETDTARLHILSTFSA